MLDQAAGLDPQSDVLWKKGLNACWKKEFHGTQLKRRNRQYGVKYAQSRITC